MSIFNTVPVTKLSRSIHNQSHQVKTSFDMGKLVPIMTELSMPGDSWRVGLEQFVRTMPMIAPVMDRMDIKVDAFFVPLRLIWDDFEDFITLGPTGEFNVEHPTITVGANESFKQYFFEPGTLADYLNFPSVVTDDDQVLDALPFRAYQLIYNEYYRNQDLEDEIPIIKSSGNTIIHNVVHPSYYLNFIVRNRGWRKDYFTSALPNPQKGPAVRLPQSDIQIAPDGDFRFDFQNEDPVQSPDPVATFEYDGTDGNVIVEGHAVGDGGIYNMPLEYYSGLKTVGSQLPTIEELRYAETLQEFYEANARGGSRYKEYLLNIWHTRSKDSRLDRPEYLGGYRGPITITDVDQTSQSDQTAQGHLSGKGLSSGGNRLFKFHTPEWGIIMVIMSVQPKSSYFQGFRKWNLYSDVFDWPNPFFANLGEQEIQNQELYFTGDSDYDTGTFGYTPRYAEMKYIPDSVHGQFKTTLDYWHLARKFSSRPNLNSNFVHVQPQEGARIFPDQVMNNDKFLGTFYFHIRRKMYLPYYGVPRLIHSV